MASPTFAGRVLLILFSVELTAASSACPWLPPLSGHCCAARLQFGLLSMRKMILGEPAVPPDVPRKISMSSAQALPGSTSALRISIQWMVRKFFMTVSYTSDELRQGQIALDETRTATPWSMTVLAPLTASVADAWTSHTLLEHMELLLLAPATPVFCDEPTRQPASFGLVKS